MSPRTKGQFEEIRKRSRQTIKDAALELFAHLGYHSTSISRIAKEAGVSKGLLYNYFDSKEALLEEILMDAAKIGEDILAKVLQQEETPKGILRAMIHTAFDYIQENLHYWKLLTAIAFQAEVLEDHVPRLRLMQIESNNQLIGLFEAMNVPNARAEALACSATMDGIFIQFLQMGEDYPLDEMQDYLVNRYCT